MTATELPVQKTDKRALHMYNFLRIGNPHLPEPNKVAAFEPMKLQFGPEIISTLTLSLIVDLPEGGISDDGQEAPSA